jgi:hypothetical protein
MSPDLLTAGGLEAELEKQSPPLSMPSALVPWHETDAEPCAVPAPTIRSTHMRPCRCGVAAETVTERRPWLPASKSVVGPPASATAEATSAETTTTADNRIRTSRTTRQIRARGPCARFHNSARTTTERGFVMIAHAVRVRVLTAVAVAALLVVAAALGSVPRRTNVAFASAPLGSPSTFASVTRRATSPAVVLAARARRVAVVHWNGDRPLLVAPTTAGGFCESLPGPYGGAGCFTGSRQRNVIDSGLTADAAGPIAFNGKFFDSRGARLEVRYEDGLNTVVPIIWVGKPINAGFFVFAIPSSHRRPGHRPIAITLFSRSGTRLAHAST